MIRIDLLGLLAMITTRIDQNCSELIRIDLLEFSQTRLLASLPCWQARAGWTGNQKAKVDIIFSSAAAHSLLYENFIFMLTIYFVVYCTHSSVISSQMLRLVLTFTSCMFSLLTVYLVALSHAPTSPCITLQLPFQYIWA